MPIILRRAPRCRLVSQCKTKHNSYHTVLRLDRTISCSSCDRLAFRVVVVIVSSVMQGALKSDKHV